MKNELDTLLQKEMDRKGFLKHLGMGFIAMIGVAGILKTLNSFGGNTGGAGGGYGSSAYGGTRTTTAKAPSEPRTNG